MCDNVLVPSGINIPKVKFESNNDFQQGNATQDSDSAFVKLYKKSWMQPKGDPRVNREVLTTLLASEGGEYVGDCIEKLLAEEISYRDLGSLNETDLELMGFGSHKQREELLNFFKLLPNQDPCYESILKLPEAKTYNSKILTSATGHLEAIRSAMAAANYKLQIMPTEDVIVGDKYFASKFVMEALNEIEGLTNEIGAEIQELNSFTSQNKKSTLQKKETKNSERASTYLWILIGSIATGTLAAVWFWKLSK